MPVTSSPAKKTVPFRTGSRPKMVFMKVDLPAPLGPMMVTISPSSTPYGDPVQDLHLAVARDHIASLQHRHRY